MKIQSKEQRDQLKNDAVVKREQGKLSEALEIFSEIEKWDEQNEDYTGQVDVLGHLRLVYVMMMPHSTNKEELAKKAMVCVDKALSIIKTRHLDSGSLAITKVHRASVLRGLALLESNATACQKILTEALSEVEDALASFPGSLAHLAWPLNQKANILLLQGDFNKAYDAMLEGQKMLFEGYCEELSNGDQAEIKLPIWLSGLYITAAGICKAASAPILADFYIQSVLNMPDPNGILKGRKREALEFLKQ